MISAVGCLCLPADCHVKRLAGQQLKDSYIHGQADWMDLQEEPAPPELLQWLPSWPGIRPLLWSPCISIKVSWRLDSSAFSLVLSQFDGTFLELPKPDYSAHFDMNPSKGVCSAHWGAVCNVSQRWPDGYSKSKRREQGERGSHCSNKRQCLDLFLPSALWLNREIFGIHV